MSDESQKLLTEDYLSSVHLRLVSFDASDALRQFAVAVEDAARALRECSMNVETGRIYRGEIEIEAAELRGESVVFVSPRVARIVSAGQRALSKTKRKMARQSKRNNRD